MQFPIRDNQLFAEVEVFGVSDKIKRKIEVTVDTGFSGYLSMPFVIAFPLGLILKGQQPYTLADGSVSNHFICLGTVQFNGKSAVVPIDVQPSGPILMGVQLMKKLDLELSVKFSANNFSLARIR